MRTLILKEKETERVISKLDLADNIIISLTPNEDLLGIRREPIKEFEYRCLCNWSKNGEYGFISNTSCPVHGESAKKLLEKSKDVKIK